MKKILAGIFAICSTIALGQSDGCSSATVINVTANCSSPNSGTTTGATQTIAGCTGNADDDVWYQFVATQSSHQIVVSANAGMDPVVQLFSGGCGTLISLVCMDNYGDGGTETINYNGLTIGNTYRIRVYHYFAGSGTGNFQICVTNPPPAPSNDACGNAINLSVNTSCSYTNATTDGASESFPGCAGTADDDVWFTFVATNSVQNILVNPIDNLDLVFQVYSGTCGSLNSLLCEDNTFTGQQEQSNIVGLIPGQVYYVRVYDYYQGNTGDFQICITGAATAAPTNDEPCNAIQLPEVTSECQYGFFTTNGATTSVGPPIPSACAGGSAPQQGGFQSGTQDVWFAITVPSSGNVDVTAYPNGGAGYITDGVMALYSGSCSSLTQIACSDDNDYPGTGNDYLPFISASGLTPGTTVYLRYWDWGLGGGDFGICASTVTNDDCANALYICDINGYSASTSASYTADHPDNMRGNAEQNDPPVYTYTPGTNTGGIFGQGGPWGTGAPAFDVRIDNNSWIKFTASSTTATLNVSIYDCWVGNYPSGGIQMQIFSGNNCTNFVPVSNFEESSTGFTITANNLTIGNDYYLMVDGYAGDICNYTITANSGVQFPDIADVPPICEGESVTLSAPPGATSYLWAHDGSTTQTVTVTPSTTQTYYCEVTGLCDYKQTLDVTVTVNPNPTVSITNGSNISICNGESVTLTATGASTYSWDIPATGAAVTVSPASNVTYNVTGTDGNGCTDNASINININALPTLTNPPTATDSDCGGSNGALTGALGSGANPITYEWSDGSSVIGNAQNLTGIPAGTYYLTIYDGNGCSETFGPYSVVNPGAPPAPSITVTDDTPCEGGSAQLTATSSMGGATFNWSGPSSFSSSNATITLNNVTTNNQGNYCVTATVAGCTGPAACQTITIDPLPSVILSVGNNDSTICLGSDFTVSASGATSYTWTGPNGFASSNSTETVTNADNADAGYYYVTGIDLNGCSNTDSMVIVINPLPTLSLNADNANATYCLGGIATLEASGASSYTWSGPDGYTSSGDTVIVLDLAAVSEGYYIVQGTDAEGCIGTDSLFVDVVTNVPAQAPGDTIICPGDDYTLSGSGGVAFYWNGPNGFYSEEQNPTLSDLGFDASGWYTLLVIDTNGCSGFDSTYVTIEDNDCLNIPNLVTPNNDGHNDIWVINGIDKYPDASVEIYNRWGNLIFKVSPYNNDWSGQVTEGLRIGSEDKVPSGTYFYILELNDDEHDPFKGYVEVEY